ncbi:MAG: 6-phosphofructokinase [candidate division Zixibacteria bacterium]|nr:6-phosphofructokinase [candidate division Zixibacteria bacterium]
MRLGILTGGGDCPGLNAAIRAVTRRSIDTYGSSVVGIHNGWAGLIHGDTEPLSLYSVSGILHRGGTILGTSRTNPIKHPDGIERIKENIKKFELDAVVAIGGEDTLGAAAKLNEAGIPMVGLPKTIDNDIVGTDATFGFDTAVMIATDAIDRLHTTAESHHRVMVIEVMGRHTGWIAIKAGIAGGADCILIPEVPMEIGEVCHLVNQRKQRGKTFSLIVVAEGFSPKNATKLVTQDDKVDEFGHVRLGGIGHLIGVEIERLIDIETRVTILGHIQRGGSPTAYDRVLATQYGVAAADLLHNGGFGRMVALNGTKIESIPLTDIIGKIRKVDNHLYEIARVFFG